MKPTLYTLLICLSAMFAGGCGTLQEKARDTLASRNIPFEKENFEKVIKNGDIEGVKLFLDAGMSPDVKLVRRYKAGGLRLHVAAHRRFNPVDIVGSDGKIYTIDNQYIPVKEENNLSEKYRKTVTIAYVSPLRVAIESARFKIIDLLIKRGAAIAPDALDVAEEIQTKDGYNGILGKDFKRMYKYLKSVKIIRKQAIEKGCSVKLPPSFLEEMSQQKEEFLENYNLGMKYYKMAKQAKEKDDRQMYYLNAAIYFSYALNKHDDPILLEKNRQKLEGTAAILKQEFDIDTRQSIKPFTTSEK